MTYPARSSERGFNEQGRTWTIYLPNTTQKTSRGTPIATEKRMLSLKPIKPYTHFFRIRSRSQDGRADVFSYKLLTLGTRILTAHFFCKKKSERSGPRVKVNLFY